MLTFLRYAWPVLMCVAVQVLAYQHPAKAGWQEWRVWIWVGLDLFIGGAQYWNWRGTKRIERQIEELREEQRRLLDRMGQVRGAREALQRLGLDVRGKP